MNQQQDSSGVVFLVLFLLALLVALALLGASVLGIWVQSYWIIVGVIALFCLLGTLV